MLDSLIAVNNTLWYFSLRVSKSYISTRWSRYADELWKQVRLRSILTHFHSDIILAEHCDVRFATKPSLPALLLIRMNLICSVGLVITPFYSFISCLFKCCSSTFPGFTDPENSSDTLILLCFVLWSSKFMLKILIQLHQPFWTI